MRTVIVDAMQAFLEQILQKAMTRLREHSELVGLANVEEFTFRAFVMAEIMGACPTARCQAEWHKVDLLVQRDGLNALVEFKFYLTRRTVLLDGSPSHWKGGASRKNLSEFQKCVEKLRNFENSEIHRKFLVLVYEALYPKKSRYSFGMFYDQIKPDKQMTSVDAISHVMEDRVTCKLIQIA